MIKYFYALVIIFLTGCVEEPSIEGEIPTLKTNLELCNKGVGYACWNVAILYYTGEAGTTKSYLKASNYYSLACQLGEGSACNSLASMYLKGEGLIFDAKKGLSLQKKACLLGNDLGCKNYNSNTYGIDRD